ncbi:pyridine nucleotide-disulfide oxidoreductase domain-containing protein 2 isoform X2 [Aphelocoma coerulescens]|uniref:pyridine nucleotide-disulfide oxidoreductase domain-containing protein 2 isoform X2 n=1 Tax=Aphelocoma coerulescens TaxID=39617 RepID=UPI0036044377
MAAGLPGRLSLVCSSRWLQGWHLSLGPSGARLAHAGAAARLQREYDAVVIGAGHNGLVAAAYLQQAGLRTAVLEKRHVLGGAAVTEEIVPGFKFSRASYLLSLLRPQIYADLELQRHGLRVLPRDPYSFTPLLEDRSPPRSLLLGHDMAQTQQQIAQFSQKDAQAYPEYEAFMGRMVLALDPLLDAPPVDTAALGKGSVLQQLRNLRTLKPLLQAGLALGRQLPRYYEVLTAPISKILDQWFESEPLKATLATDAVIGAMASPHTPGSGYVLLHHVMGELEGRRGAWGYVAGGMGALSQAIAHAATARGAHIFAEKEQLPKDFVQRIRQVDTCSPVTKINVAVDRLPSFLAAPNARNGQPLPHHQCSIHLNCEGTQLLHQAFTEAAHGHPSSRPMIELCIPSALDPGLAPPGCHVVSLFTQYTPSVLAGGRSWDEQARNAYADTVFDCIEDYAPGFKASVIGRDILTPPDLERIFGLPGGNIFHGGMSLDQLYFARPAPSYSGYRSPIPGLYLCGSGAHPGGGVMGAAGRNAAQVAIKDFRHL